MYLTRTSPASISSAKKHTDVLNSTHPRRSALLLVHRWSGKEEGGDLLHPQMALEFFRFDFSDKGLH